MNKMKKLLSVLLAVVLALSCMSVMASAAKTEYKTVENLTNLGAYSPYGQVTRLSTEERASMVQDFLDNLLPSLGINMGEVFNVLGLSITLDLSSVDRLCYSLDTVKDTLSNGLAGIAMGIVNLGVLEELEMGTWATGITRDGSSQLTLFAELLELLSSNTGLVNSVLTNGLDLGIVGGLLGGVDLSSINDIVKNLPGMIKGLIYPMIERWDDNLAVIKELDGSIAGTSKDYTSVEAVVNWRVKKLFTDNMSITTIKYDADGNMTSEHKKQWLATATGSAAPTASDESPRCYYQIAADGKTMYSYHIVDAAEAEALAKDTDETNDVEAYNYIKENQVYRLEQEVDGSATYVWKAYKLDENGNKTGEINHAANSGSSGAVIFTKCADVNAAWEFIKWFTSDEVQVQYGRTIEGQMGQMGRYDTANVNALAQLPWSNAEYEKISTQMNQTVEIPIIPASYATTRHVKNAFRAVVNDTWNPRYALSSYNRDINSEIERKNQDLATFGK